MSAVEFVGTVRKVERRQNSVNGNPTYRFTFEGGQVFETKRDAGFAYEVTSSWEGRSFTVTVQRGRIVGMVAL